MTTFVVAAEWWLRKPVANAFEQEASDFGQFSALVQDDVLHNITVHIAAGNCLAVVGATSAGKSTLTSLLTRVDTGRAAQGTTRITAQKHGSRLDSGHNTAPVYTASLTHQSSTSYPRRLTGTI